MYRYVLKYINEVQCKHNLDIPITYHCMLGNFSSFCCRLLTFFKITFSKNSFKNTISVSNALESDQDPHSVSSDLGPNCSQRLLADDQKLSLQG